MDKAKTQPAPEKKPEAKAVEDRIRCKVSIPGSHVGEILCDISASTPEKDRHLAACRAAAEARGIVVSAAGQPQFSSAPTVEYLEN